MNMLISMNKSDRLFPLIQQFPKGQCRIFGMDFLQFKVLLVPQRRPKKRQCDRPISAHENKLLSAVVLCFQGNCSLQCKKCSLNYVTHHHNRDINVKLQKDFQANASHFYILTKGFKK